ncbi:MAG TPA: biotin--[acetyl-CoA-carboxylase] ligase [Thermoanaerobacterales bacterium]|nr:biotin--[acetyl-CoA-carboxylase] ligase [Thermoanaerobacterales bacterium]
MPGQKNIEIVRERKNPDMLLMMMLAAKSGYVSGEELSRKFGVSRSAIWKQINHLRELGYELESSTRLGYRILKSPDLLFPEEIWSKADLSFLGDRIYYYSTIGSTNSEAKRIAQEGAPHGTLIIAEEQTKGKGRMGRSWTSPRGTGIWISIIMKPQMMPSEAPKLTILTAVAVAEAINEETNINAVIKWPNDILIQGKKVCGILTEMSAELDIVNYVVIGVGINVNNDTFPEEVKDRAISLKIAKGKTVDRLRVLACFLEKLEKHYAIAMSQGFEAVFDRWRKLCCNLGKPVEIVTKNGFFSGVAIDIDEHGALIVKKDDGNFEKLFSGDVSLKQIE